MAEKRVLSTVLSFKHSTLAYPDETKPYKVIEMQQSQQISQKLVHGLIPSDTFLWSYQVYYQFPRKHFSTKHFYLNWSSFICL